jgi:predicted phage terminase large subunit-like protein
VTTPGWVEHTLRLLQPQTPRWATPGALAAHITPKSVQTRALDVIDTALVELADTPDGRLIITLPPQEGKSTRVAGDYPLWWLLRNLDARIVVASYGQALATRNGRAIRRRITEHPDLGLRIADDNGAVHEWTLAGHDGGVLSVGIGGGLTGRPADLLIIDDPIKDRQEADSAPFRDRVWDWWLEVGSTRLAPGAPVVVILTRWHADDLAGRLLAAEDGDEWRVVNIPAQADHDPLKGETDLLDREVGEFLDSARGRTTEQWARIRVRSGSRTWNALYQGRPSPEQGDILHRDWWPRYETPMWVERPDGSRFVPLAEAPGCHLIQSWDMTFKDTAGTDFVVGQVWLSDGVNAWLIDQVRDRMSFVQTLRSFVALSARWPQASLKLVEDKANGPAVISSLRRRVGGIVAEEPHGSKTSRVSAVAPFVEAGNVWLPDDLLSPWVTDLVEEAAAFPTGAHDDQVDAASQALTRLLLTPVMAGERLVTMDDLDDELAGYRLINY